MFFDVFAEQFPASFREHHDRLRNDSRYRQEFQTSVQRLGNRWYETPKWRMTVKLLRLLHPLCTVCGTTHDLQAHHKTYEHFGLELLYLDDLEMLCDRCHREYHGIVSPTGQMHLRLPPTRHHIQQGVNNGPNFVHR
jgi:5-methylcytosine-specific restriction endonuclease McrA